MCGGDITIEKDTYVATCDYCGSTITLPKIDSDKKLRMFNRANQYRINCEYEKAYDTYKAIVDEDETEAEAYWGMILSEYGVEYIEDPISKKRIPTCHRTKIDSIQSTTNFSLACKYADSESKFIYQDEAEELDRIQKEILAISAKEDDYDVFICYKETNDLTGERTEDSIIAQEIYNELVKNNLKVFFSRISLADKLGKDYEPYIYSALKSARIMLVVCTSNDRANSVWVKNEWQRYLNFIKEDSSKLIIPVYKDMNAYELPDALSRFQGQDYAKVGALQDIVQSVKKIISTEEREKKDSEIEDLIREKKDRELKAFEKQIRRTKQFAVTKKIVISIGILVVIGILVTGAIKVYDNVIYPNRLYEQAMQLAASGEYDEAMDIFNQLNGYKDSLSMIPEMTYRKAIQNFEEGRYEFAISLFQNIKDYKDSEKYIRDCIVDIALQEEQYDSRLDDIKDELTEEQLLRLGELLFNQKKYTKSLGLLKKCLKSEEGLNLYKKVCYEKIISTNYGASKELIKELYNLANGTTISELEPSLNELAKSEAAQKKIDELAEEAYQKGLSDFNATNWGSAKKDWECISILNYKDTNSLIMACDDNIAKEKSVFDGIWIEATKYGTHIKIQNGKMWSSGDNASKKNKDWHPIKEARYDEDNGTLSFRYWTNDSYDVIVNGNTMTLKRTSILHEYDIDWFHGLNKFYKSEY